MICSNNYCGRCSKRAVKCYILAIQEHICTIVCPLVSIFLPLACFDMSRGGVWFPVPVPQVRIGVLERKPVELQGLASCSVGSNVPETNHKCIMGNVLYPCRHSVVSRVFASCAHAKVVHCANNDRHLRKCCRE